MPQLDSLRALAVFAVMVHHFWNVATLGLPFGFLGVQLFFVLSGFLITGILLRARHSIESGQRTWPNIRRFYVRRFFRIFPLFYIALASAWVLGVPEVRSSWLWHVSYTSNVYFARIGYWPGNVAHFWSLAVEEQFYLAWPFIIIFTPSRWLLPTLASFVMIAPAFRLSALLLGIHWMWVLTLPLGNFDSLALGGILAYTIDRQEHERSHKKLVTTGLWVGMPVCMLLVASDSLATHYGVDQLSSPIMASGRAVLENTAWALFFVWLIDRASTGFRGMPGRCLEFPPLLYAGQISYGLYVIHNFMPAAVQFVFR